MGGTMGQIGNMVGGGGNLAGIGRYASLANSGISLKLTDEMKRTIGAILAHGDDRAAFKAILLATVEHVSKKPHFNCQLEINDLWIKLTNLRDDIAKAEAGRSTGGAGVFGGSSGLGGIAGVGSTVGSIAGSLPISLSPGITSVLGDVLKGLKSRKR